VKTPRDLSFIWTLDDAPAAGHGVAFIGKRRRMIAKAS
jgi:hypothetical protein